MPRIALLIMGLGFTASGCNPYTYINIPEQDGDLARHNPNSPTVRQLESVALNALLARSPIDGPFMVVLPQGSDILSYERVLPTVSDRAVPPDHGAQLNLEETLTVRAIRARATKAEVDILRASRRTLSTVYLHYSPVSSWTADRIHDWGTIEDLSIRQQQ